MKASDNPFPGILIRESANDGSDFSNPSADYRVAFLGEDGLWHVKDSAGSVTDPFSGSSGDVATDSIWDAAGDLAVGTGANTAAKLPIGANKAVLGSNGTTASWVSRSLLSAFTNYTSGDISVTSSTVGASFPSVSQISVAAVSGDRLSISLSTRVVTNATPKSCRMDVASWVSAAPVNYVSSRSGTAATTGVPSWLQPSSTSAFLSVGGPVIYAVQSGDISGGTVTLQLCGWLHSATGSVTWAAGTSGDALQFAVVNLGQ